MASRTEEPARSGAGNRTGARDRDASTVLLVEPDRATRQLYAREIGRLWEVFASADVQEARRRLLAGPAIAIVLEPYTAGETEGEPGMDAAWAFVQECVARGDTPVVICSVVDERPTAYALGAALYLLKPVSPQQLVFALQGLTGAAATKEHTP